jgi:serine/threonine-protein kinase RsbW
MTTFELEAPAVPTTLDLVQDLVEQMWTAGGADIGFTDRMRFESALVEIVGNVIEHSVAPVADGVVTVRVALTRRDRDLVADISDDGRTVSLDLEAMAMSAPDQENGRGLAMARAMSEELRYERVGPVNRWVVRCRCPR